MPSPLSRLHRAAKPTARRAAAAAAPSSSAPARVASANKVTKPKRVRSAAERRSDNAVTVGLVSAAQREVIEDVLEPIQQRVAAAAASLVLFRYSAQWILRHVDGVQLQAGGDFHNTDVVDEAFATANAAVDRGIAEHPTTMLVRKQLSAGYLGLAERQWVPAAFNAQGWSFLVEHLKDWHVAGKRSLTLKAVVTMRDVEVADIGYEDEQPIAAAAANTSRVRNTPIPTPRSRVRNTATNLGLASMPAERELMEVGGNWASAITARWTCSKKSCAFHQKGCCYWTGRDDPTYHVPIIAAVLTSWAAGIRDGELTAAAPTHEMYGLMMAAKHENQQRGGSSRVDRGVTVNNYAPPPSPMAPVPALSILPSQTSGGKVYSSPVRMPSDPPELSALEQLDAFFAWCKADVEWRGIAVRLDEILLLVKANGDNVHTMANISKDDWAKDINVADGYRKRLKMSAKVWINSGMPIVQGPV